MSMLPGNYKNVLNKAYTILNKAISYLHDKDQDGLKKPIYFVNEIQDSIVECSQEIGRLEILIGQLKKDSNDSRDKYIKMQTELEAARKELIEMLNKLGI